VATTNEQLLSNAIQHAVHNSRFGRGLALRIVKLLNSADRDLTAKLTAKLAELEGPVTLNTVTARINSVIEAIRFINDAVYTQLAGELRSQLVDFATLEATYSADALTKAVTVDWTAKVPTPTYLKTLVENSPVDGFVLKPWVDQMSENRLSRIEKQLRVGLLAGEAVPDLRARVQNVLPISRRSAETLARTAVSSVANQTRLALYRENDDMVKAVQFVAVLDDRTSEECQSCDGDVYELDAIANTPPLHPNCRSTLVPVTMSWKELGIDRKEADEGTRASMTGEVPAQTTYPEWLKSQSEETQQNVLGIERARLFRDGEITAKDLYRDDGSYRSLDELKKRLSR
jgi:SPP1 gp7 family putative phage head morphogenesis protein